MRISAQQRQHNEARIRAAIDRLLRGDIPAAGGCDVKTLAREAGVDRTAFYGARPYAHLREEFETRLQALLEAGEVPDLRVTQIARLKNEIETLKLRLASRDQTITTLTDFKTEALSRLAAQHDEITRLRAVSVRASNVRRLPARASAIGPCPPGAGKTTLARPLAAALGFALLSKDHIKETLHDALPRPDG
jgi:predicted kinase